MSPQKKKLFFLSLTFPDGGTYGPSCAFASRVTFVSVTVMSEKFLPGCTLAVWQIILSLSCISAALQKKLYFPTEGLCWLGGREGCCQPASMAQGQGCDTTGTGLLLLLIIIISPAGFAECLSQLIDYPLRSKTNSTKWLLLFAQPCSGSLPGSLCFSTPSIKPAYS